MIRLKRLRTGTLLLCVASTWVATLMAAQPDPAPSGTFYLDDYSSWRLQYEYTVGGLRQNWTNVSARLYPTVGSQEQDLTYYEPVFVERYKIALFERPL
jgi:hypothetical protein